MGYFSQYALELMEHPLREDHSISSHTQQLQYYLDDLISALEDRGVSREALCSTDSAPLWEYYDSHARYHYYEILFAGNASIRDLIAAAGEVALRLREEQPVEIVPFLKEQPLAEPFEQLWLTA